MELVEWQDLKLDISEIYRRMGMPDVDSERSISFRPTVEKVRLRALELMSARCVYDYFPVEISGNDTILLNGKYPLSASTSFFEGAEEVAAAVLTIGSALVEESVRLFKDNEMLEGMILDGCGTVAIDEVLELFRSRIIEKAAERGLQTGYNLSPGGSYVPLEAQRTIFEILDMSKIGVVLSETMLMSPVKSHSLLIPLGKSLSRPNQSCAVTCDMCSGKHTCPHSRLKFNKT